MLFRYFAIPAVALMLCATSSANAATTNYEGDATSIGNTITQIAPKGKMNPRRTRVGTIIQMPIPHDTFASNSSQKTALKKLEDAQGIARGTSYEDSSDGTGAWILCDGRMLSRDKYPALYKAIGTKYGGYGSYFSVPNYHAKGDFLRGYKKDVSGELGKSQGVLAKSPYSITFQSMTKNTKVKGSAKVVKTYAAEKIKLEQYGTGSKVLSLGTKKNKKYYYGSSFQYTYKNEHEKLSGDQVRPVNYAVSYYICARGNDANYSSNSNLYTDVATPTGSRDVQVLLSQLSAIEQELNAANDYLAQAIALQKTAREGKNTDFHDGNRDPNATHMPKDMAKWMDERGLAYDKTGGDLFNNAKEWDIAINSLRTYRDKKQGEYDKTVAKI